MNIDLNLIRVLHAVYLERNVSRAAVRLGLSQPRVSNALATLRQALNDPLFVRAPGGVLPTPLMRRLAPQLDRGLDALEDALVQRLDFDPLTSRRAFRVQMSDSAELLFATPLRQMLQRLAPGVSLHSVSRGGADISQVLANGDVDFAVGRYRGNESILQRRLFDERYVVISDASLGAVARVDQTALADLEYLVVGDYPDVAQLIADFGLENRIRLRTSSYLAVPAILPGSGLSVWVPYGIACLMRPLGPFVMHEPCQPPRRIPLAVYCHRLAPLDPGLAWMWERMVPAICYPESLP
ncbi:LysR family transcriptional regulator [Pseudomonas sp. MWU16-30317]|uniref:LysR family transcriptional regulator n=1 Tax=Pseudomonas sp. MWU16-30317 TaxID=2878095 RepID=UPI001CFB34B0|nr:LysR family transcriptional regulator [Pseudomonas sp. MWU16-30317]